MSNETLVTLAKGGAEERTVKACEIEIPDLWHLCTDLRCHAKYKQAAEQILEVWYLAHHLKRHIVETEDKNSPCPSVPSVVKENADETSALPGEDKKD
jgi:hypothetical protein